MAMIEHATTHELLGVAFSGLVNTPLQQQLNYNSRGTLGNGVFYMGHANEVTSEARVS
jgi:hypothetical protein